VQSIIAEKGNGSNNISNSVQRAVAQVRENVYPKMDEFVIHATIAIQHHFQVPIDPSLDYDFTSNR
jgi:hypothetical protein